MRQAKDRPNIILINCDDLGYGDLGCYGSKVNKTPALDKMAAEGIRFSDFYMASPVCSPSRGAMMTGCYPPRISFGTFGENDEHGVLFPGMADGLNPKEKTIAAILKGKGYATKLVGKWHCGDQPDFLPTSHGFDEYYGIPFSNDMGRQAGREDRNWPPLPLLHNKEVIQQQPDQAALTERYVEECVEFIREKKDGPFFLYFAHMYVHLPIYASEKFMKQSQNGRYGAGVECVDWTIAVIRDELERQGLTENTLVIFTSDNGSRARGEGGSNDPLRGYKGTTWEGGQRLPCIMCWPKTLAAGKTCKQIAASIDFLPTFAKLAGTEAPADRIIDGLDLTGLMENPEGESPRDTFFYYHRNDLEAVRKGRWKLHVAKNWQEFEYDIMLVDLENDIGEQVNVAEQNPEIVAELQALLEECRKDMGDARKGIKGENVRPRHFVDNPKPLTEYNENHPYIYAEYDLGDAG